MTQSNIGIGAIGALYADFVASKRSKRSTPALECVTQRSDVEPMLARAQQRNTTVGIEVDDRPEPTHAIERRRRRHPVNRRSV
jgi:hypothetical protein